MTLEFVQFNGLVFVLIFLWTRVERIQRGPHTKWLLSIAAMVSEERPDKLRASIRQFLYLICAILGAGFLLTIFGQSIWQKGLPILWVDTIWLGIAFLCLNGCSNLTVMFMCTFIPVQKIAREYLNIPWVKDVYTSERIIARTLVIALFECIFFHIVVLSILLQTFEDVTVGWKLGAAISFYLFHQLLRTREIFQAILVGQWAFITAISCNGLGLITQNVLLASFLHIVAIIVQVKINVQTRDTMYLQTAT